MTKLQILLNNTMQFQSVILMTVINDKDYEIFKKFVYDNQYSQFYKESGIHGIGHIERVLLLSFYLFICLRDVFYLNKTDLIVILFSAAYHDVGRFGDKEDENHGKKSADIFSGLGKVEDVSMVNDICEIIIAHSLREYTLEYYTIKSDYDIHEKRYILLRLLRDADILDRVRFFSNLGLDYKKMKIKRFLNPNSLYFDISKSSIEEACQLLDVL